MRNGAGCCCTATSTTTPRTSLTRLAQCRCAALCTHLACLAELAPRATSERPVSFYRASLASLGRRDCRSQAFPFCARVIPWGEGQLKPCCDDISGCGLLFCVEGGVDITLVLGTVRKPGVLDDPRRHTRQQVGFRDRSAYIFSGESLPTCGASLRAGVRAFVRGSAGTGLGYQFNWVVADGHWDCVWPGGCSWTGSWFVNDFQHGAAWGVVGYSIETGLTFYASGCFQVASCN